MKPLLENKNDKSARVNIFSELMLTDKFRHYLRLNAASYIDFDYLFIDYLYIYIYITYILIAYTSYITYTYDYKALY